MDKARYIEPLSSGGNLTITPDGWFIQFYFGGPDLRHSGEFVYIQGIEVDAYINAFKNNFLKYIDLQKTLPENGEFTMKGECNMNIGCGGYHNGVTIAAWYNHLSNSCYPICTQRQLDSVICDLEYCKIRATEIFNLLFGK